MNTSTVSKLQSDLISGKTTSAKITADFVEIYKKDSESKDALKGYIDLYADAADKASAADAEIAEARKNG